MSTEIVLVAFGVILFIVMVYSYLRDSENSRQIRFLQSRGFNMEQISAALKN